jgi:hypothetical protein
VNKTIGQIAYETLQDEFDKFMGPDGFVWQEWDELEPEARAAFEVSAKAAFEAAKTIEAEQRAPGSRAVGEGSVHSG